MGSDLEKKTTRVKKYEKRKRKRKSPVPGRWLGGGRRCLRLRPNGWEWRFVCPDLSPPRRGTAGRPMALGGEAWSGWQ